MIQSIIILSLISSLFLFHIDLPRGAIIPLVVSMYILFTNGSLHKKDTDWQFSRYHILFGLWCTIIVGLSLLLNVFGISLLIILYTLVGLHMLIIWCTLIWEWDDEFHMFHIGYYFIMCILLWYLPTNYGIHNGLIGLLLFPVITFLLYAGGTFFIHPFIHLPIQWHYRTAVFFLVSFLSSIILYFFSIPIIGWTAALLLYVGIIRFLVYQYRSFALHEKRKNVYAEDILAGKKVIQAAESIWHSSQVFITRIIQKLSFTLRISVVWCSIILFTGTIISAFFSHTNLGITITFILLLISYIGVYYANTGWYTLGYPTAGADAVLGLGIHTIFAWVLRSSIGTNFTTFVFIGMSWTIIHHGISILLGKQSHTWPGKRKYPLLYGYTMSNIISSIGIAVLFSYLGLDSVFTIAINLLYIGIVGTMVYFFSRSLSSKPNRGIIIEE